MVDVRLDNQSDYFCRITGEDLGVSRGTRDGDACWVPVIMTQLCLPATPRGKSTVSFLSWAHANWAV